MLRLAIAAIALAGASFSAQAQSNWPNKPVKILVPTAAGGTADSTARMFALHLGKVLGQQFYVENRGGAGNVLGIDSVARSPADGYTLLLGAGTITINHLVYKKLPYDVLRDLMPVTQMVSVPNVLVVHASQPMKTLAEYIAAAKAAPGKINYASAGVGSNLHLAMELLKYRTGIDVTHVPYKGVGPAMSDTLAGHVMSMVSNVASAKPHIEAGKLRALGVTSLKRTKALPDVPSIVGGGRQGLRGAQLVRAFRPRGHTQGDRRPSAGRGRGDVCRSGNQPPHCRRRRGAGGEQARRVRGVRARRNQEVGRGRQGREHPADGMMSARGRQD